MNAYWSDYYRGNNNGLGVLIGVIEEPMIEGFGRGEVTDHEDFFAPRDAINFASWATNADNAQNITVPGISHSNYPSLLLGLVK